MHMYKLWGLLPVICRLPNDSGFDTSQHPKDSKDQCNTSALHSPQDLLATTTITVISHSDFAVVVYTFLSGTS